MLPMLYDARANSSAQRNGGKRPFKVHFSEGREF